ncbi:MAG: zinc-ribbon domain-containing protein [Firmicutes bacterium]|nr:zinc-ribbon domain-containing protein [Bacillota bacterium]
MKCNSCGTEVTNPAAVFCPNCGSALNGDANAAAASAAAAAAAAAAAVQPKPEPQPLPQPDPRQSALFNENWAPIVKTGEWIGSLLIVFLVPMALSIIAVLVEQLLGAGPVATVLSILALFSGLIIMLIFAFGKRFNPSKRNFFKAYLIITVIMIVLVIILSIVVFSFAATNGTDLTDLMDIAKQMNI